MNPKELIKSIITNYANSSGNTLMNAENESAWEKPLIGFANGADPIWDELKKDIGSFYWTPAEIFSLTFPSVKASPEELVVISWILPQTARTKADQRKEKTYPSERWSRSRKFGEEFNQKLGDHLAKTLNEAGHEAVYPLHHPGWKTIESGKYGISSNWSERHAAYAAGLGTFGLCDGLITPAGKAMRCGSVVARMKMQTTPRNYQDHHAYCLFFAKGTCGKCIDRCPAGAVTKQGHDKKKCMDYLHGVTREHIKANYGFEAYGCGLCQSGVPCESGIPVK
jgi:epoxyqueuosine reductase